MFNFLKKKQEASYTPQQGDRVFFYPEQGQTRLRMNGADKLPATVVQVLPNGNLNLTVHTIHGIVPELDVPQSQDNTQRRWQQV